MHWGMALKGTFGFTDNSVIFKREAKKRERLYSFIICVIKSQLLKILPMARFGTPKFGPMATLETQQSLGPMILQRLQLSADGRRGRKLPE